ncbi:MULTISPECIES: DNA cytosine methyltransferase [Vibrio]|uniref:DNA (Cytosine-5-)-methyltransferase n=3 Tax=Vibrio TaxID=662 RepID=A0AAU9QQV2_9VIBR|nr:MULTISPECIES: DNA cytosine methyltransferase [Vibrio]CAH1590710.1 DNA (cytosine-5-)-methyltransferase [Vibrio jasicida]KIF53040.1 hypothetical protein H735_08815 [Vibrio owensii CAIM 1854 = LMG 25443]MCZ2802033.1 DNA cytosine methyltransferase [Vibrio alginolyticus]POB46882.1 DNA cytosine methyltransferase [Vibrio vulnificus]CAH1599078.1 DNA (cytosine-5-)-methyltransferase [Vibrio jasicida]
MVKVIGTYSVKKLLSGAARIYINNASQLRRIGFGAGARYSTDYSRYRVTLKLANLGDNGVMSTDRGELVELKNKALSKSLKGLSTVRVTFEQGRIVISILTGELKRLEREQSFLKAASNGTPFRTGSICSGLGMLAYQLKEGLSQQGIDSEIAFSNDINNLALSLQLEGNPIWEKPAIDALAVAEDIRNLEPEDLRWTHILEVGYPCVGQSTLCPKDRRDLKHPDVGTLFIPLVNAIKTINPAIVIFENSVPFLKSETLDLMKRELKGYKFEETELVGYDHGDFEERKRACIIAISEGLPDLCLSEFQAPDVVQRSPISSIMEDVPEDSKAWKDMFHVKKKVEDERLNFKHNVYYGTETKVAAITAGYASPRIGSPMIENAGNGKQRLFTTVEHARIRQIPGKLAKVLSSVTKGEHPLVSKRGNGSVVHRMLGNGISPKAWFNLFSFLGQYINNLKKFAPLFV